MDLPVNAFKRALRAQRHQTGLWVTLAQASSAELVAASGFDWLLLDTEHTPATLPNVLAQLQAVAPYRSHPVVRPSWNDKVQIKQYLDIGAQTLLLPYVQNAEEARNAVAGMRYAPRGMRGVGGTVRATRYGRVADYMRQCEDELCLLVQAETGEALENLDAMLAVDGVDGVFIGPADLAASLGYPGEPGHPKVVAEVESAITRVRAAGKAPGVLTTDEALARRYMAAGSLYTAVGVDAAILARHCDQLAQRFRTA